MSSVPKIAAAQASGFPPDSPPSSSQGLRVVPPAEPRADDLLHVALEADEGARPLGCLSKLWEDHVACRFQFCFETMRPDRILSVARENPGRAATLHPGDESIVLRVLCGEQQKVLALEIDVAISTLSTRYNRALHKLGLASHEVPTSLVLAAQCAAGMVSSVPAQSASFEHEGVRYCAVSVRRPCTAHLHMLSAAERQVAAWVIEGCSRREVATRRASSKHTASRHIHAVFARLQVSGRYALIRRAVELGCFRPAE